MKRSWFAAALGMLTAVALVSNVAVSPVEAGKDNPGQDKPRNRPKGDDVYTDPVVSGMVTGVAWSESKNPNQKTATLFVWSNDADQSVSVYGSDPTVRDAIVSGLACVGRYVIAVGDRIDANALEARSIQVPDLSQTCTQTLAPLPGMSVPKPPTAAQPTAAARSAPTPTPTPEPTEQISDDTDMPLGEQTQPEGEPSTEEQTPADTSNQGQGGNQQTTSALSTASPDNIVLRLEDVGKEIKQLYSKPSSDGRGKSVEVRFERDPKRLDAGWGPIRIVSRAYVANDVAGAQSIYNAEVGKQRSMPEAKDPVGSLFTPDPTEVTMVGDQLDAIGACNAGCSGKDFNSTHRRTVLRAANVVVVTYFWGGRDSSTAKQMNDWVTLVSGRY